MKSGQAWGFDLIAGIIVFVSGIIFFYIYSLNYSGDGDDNLSRIRTEASLIADSLMTPGFPVDWEKESVVRIGIYDDGKINETKLTYLYEMLEENYGGTKGLFNVIDDFYLSFPGGVEIEEENVETFGFVSNESDNLIKVSRVVIYRNKLRTMEVVVWK